MKFENTFVVQAPIEEVWETLLDVERVAPCMPGAEVLERTGEDEFKVAVRVKLGPMSLQYRGQVAIVERDDTVRRAMMRARAREARGQGTADARIEMALAQQGEATRATISTELQISGRAAAMGRGMIVDVAQKLTDMFAVNLAEMLVGGPEVEAPGEGGAEDVAAGGVGAADVGAATPQAGSSDGPAQAAVPIQAPAAQATADRPSGRAPAAAARAPTPTPVESSLPVMELAASVIRGRLSNPRVLLMSGGVLALLFGAIGYAIGKRR